MKIVRFSQGAGPARAGVIMGERVIALDELVAGVPSDMCDIIADWDRLKTAVASQATARAGVPLAEVTLQAPVARPGKILAIGLNYADHIKESGMDTPKEQVWFSKHVNGINGPFAPVEMPKPPSISSLPPDVSFTSATVAMTTRSTGSHKTKQPQTPLALKPAVPPIPPTGCGPITVTPASSIVAPPF